MAQAVHTLLTRTIVSIAAISIVSTLYGCATYYSANPYQQSALFTTRAVTFPDPLEHRENPHAVQELRSGARTVANAAWWGFDPLDATEALQQALDSGASVVHIPNMGGQPWNTRPLSLRSNQEIIIEKGTTIQATRGEFHGRGDSLLSAHEVENVTIRGYGAHMRMWKQDYYSTQYELSEFRHLLSLRSTRNVTIEGLRLTESGGDGIYVGSQFGSTQPNVDTRILNVILDNHTRQAISVINARDLLIEGSWLINTNGHNPLPQAGIDFEANNPNEQIVNCVVRSTVISGNHGSGILVAVQNRTKNSTPLSLVIEDSTISGNALFSVHLFGVTPEVHGTIAFRNNTIEGAPLFGHHPSLEITGYK